MRRTFSTPSLHLNRRRLLHGLASILGTTALADALEACSPSPQPVTIHYWDWYAAQAPWVDGEISLFQKAYPHIRIAKKTIDSGTYSSVFKLATKNTAFPDVFMIPTSPSILEQVNNGWLAPLDRWANHTWRNRFPHGAFHEGNNIFNGRLYSAPLEGTAPSYQLYVNEDVFKAAGLVHADGSVAIPRTWDEVTRAAETITRKSNGSVYGLGFGNGAFNLLRWWLEVFVRGAGSPGGGYTADLRVGKYTFGSDRNYTDFLQLFLEWKQRGYFYPDSMSITDIQARALFELGKFGMTVGGVWNEPLWTAHKFTSYSMTSLISPQETKLGYFYYTPGGTFIAVSPHTPHPQEAWTWLDWLYGIEAGKHWVELGQGLSIYGQNNNPALVQFKPFAQYVALRIYAFRGPDPLVRNPQTAHVVLTAIKPHAGDVMASLFTGKLQHIQSAFSDVDGRGQKSLQDGIKQAQQRGYTVSIDDYTFPDWDITQPYYTVPAP